MTWYEQWFDRDEYELVYRDRDEADALALLDLIFEIAAPEPGARILDVGCGRGQAAHRGSHTFWLSIGARKDRQWIRERLASSLAGAWLGHRPG